MNPMLFLIGSAVAGSVAIAVLVVYGRLLQQRQAIGVRVGGGDAAGVSDLDSPLRRERANRFFLVKALPLSRETEERTRQELEQAGWPIRVREYLGLRFMCMLGGAGVGLLLFIFIHPVWLRAIDFLGFAGVGWRLPRMLLNFKRQRRLDLMEKQLADSVTAMAKSLRAGSGLLQALSHAAKETPAPLGTELQRTLRELELGAAAQDALHALSQRVRSAEMDIVVTAIMIQKTVGGNLSEILMTVANTIRERARIRAEVQTQTSRQRLTANLVALLPVGVALAFFALKPELGMLLIRTTVGQVALVVGIAFELLGLWIVRRLAIIQV